MFRENTQIYLAAGFVRKKIQRELDSISKGFLPPDS